MPGTLGYDGQFKEALEQVDFALQYEPKNHPSRLLRAQLLIAQKDWPAGRAELERYLRDRPNDADAKKLLELCGQGKADDPAVLWSVAEVFQRQKVPGLSAHLYRDVELSVKARQPLLVLYQKRIEEAWPGLGNRLRLDQTGNFLLNLVNCKQVVVLDLLKGMQMNGLNLSGCDRVTDLSPLRGMPLTSLSLLGCDKVSDLSPLQGMNLEYLSFIPQNNTKGMDVLRRMKNLKSVYTYLGGGYITITGAEFLRRYDAGEFKR